MKVIEYFTPEDTGYDAVCQFAQGVYLRELSFNLTHFPEVLFAVRGEGTIIGCMGFNTTLHFPLFVNNPRLAEVVEKSNPRLSCGEQSILALQNYSMGLPLLIAITAAYGHRVGMDKVAYAAIPVSQKTIDTLQFDTMECGPADLEMFPEQERHLYESWHSLKPVCYLLDTKSAIDVCRRVLRRFSKRVSLEQKLARMIGTYDDVSIV